MDSFNDFWNNTVSEGDVGLPTDVTSTPFGDIPSLPGLPNEGDSSFEGREPTVQTFYEGPDRCDCCVNWVEKRPNQIPQGEKDRYARAAICVYKRKDHHGDSARIGGLIDVIDQRVVIQSQFLIDLIRPALVQTGFPVPKEGSLEILAPFKELYFAHGRIKKIHQLQTPESEEAMHVELLINVMESLFGQASKSISQQLSKGTISYAYLWSLFPKNMVVYRKIKHQILLYEVMHAGPEYFNYRSTSDKTKGKQERTELGYRIRLRHFAFDGTNFGVLDSSVQIEVFEEEKPINRLEVYPIGFLPNNKYLRQIAVARGLRVLDYQNMTHCEFHGTAEGLSRKEFVFLTGRVIVDAFYYSKTEDYEPTDPFDDESLDNETDQAGETLIFHHQAHISHGQSDGTKLPRIDAYQDEKPTAAIQGANRRFFLANKRYLAVMHPNVPGYSLKHNRWFNLDVSKLKPIVWASQPLQRLVFDSDKKNILSVFAQHHARQMRSSSDQIVCKGAGLVVLLSGPPGTGKTLTAEAIADEAKFPLYRIMAGELGSEPSKIESKLTEILDLALHWRCLVLLDEADTFISTRNSLDRIANEIVSIFLRQIEYFRGIIFLTSNMPHSIDDAFRSRCRLHVHYPELEADSRREVWEINFRNQNLMTWNNMDAMLSEVEPSGKVVLSPEEWKQLVEWKLSGREIHNVVANIVLWCTSMGRDATLRELEQTIQLTVPSAKNDSLQSESPSEMEEPSDGSGQSRKRQRLD